MKDSNLNFNGYWSEKKAIEVFDNWKLALETQNLLISL